MSKNRNNVNNVNNENTAPVNPEVDEEVKAAEAAPQTEDDKPADPAPEVEKKDGIFKKAKAKVSKVWNEGFETPPFKDVVKKVVTAVGVAAAGAATAIVVIGKINSDNGECNDQYMLEESSGRNDPDFETTFEEDVPEDEE